MWYRKQLWCGGLVLLLAAAVLGGYGCTAGGTSMRFRNVDANLWVPAGEQAAYRIITGDDWSPFYRVEPPGADFNTKFYVVAYWGARPNPGYQIKIARINRSGTDVTVTVEFKEPEPDRFYPQVIVYPIAVAEVSKADLGAPGEYRTTFVDQKGNTLSTATANI